MKNKRKITGLKIVNDQIIFSVTLPKSSLIEVAWKGVSYDLQRSVSEQLKKMLINEIYSKNKDAIIKEVLSKVNWPEIVRSEIAQRVIAEAGRPKY